jgi:hypothetical protein
MVTFTGADLTCFRYIDPYPWYFDPLPMVHRPPYPWCFYPPTNGISNPPDYKSGDSSWMKKEPVSYGILTPLYGKLNPHGILTPSFLIKRYAGGQNLPLCCLSFDIRIRITPFGFGILKLFLRKAVIHFPIGSYVKNCHCRGAKNIHFKTT